MLHEDDFVDNTEPFAIIWTSDDCLAHQRACNHAIKCFVDDGRYYSDGERIIIVNQDGVPQEILQVSDLRYDILQFLDIKDRDGMRLLPPTGITARVCEVLRTKLPRISIWRAVA